MPGVAEVAAVGGYDKQYQVAVEPDKLRAYGSRSRGHRGDPALEQRSRRAPGRIQRREYMVRGRGYYESVADIEQVVAAGTNDGAPMLVRDVGSVTLGPDIRRGVGMER